MIATFRHKGLRRFSETGTTAGIHMGIGCDACAQLLGISSPLMRDLLIGVQPITPELAAKLSHALGSSPESWLRMQQIYDAWQRKTTGAGDIAK
jgi:addiction module HigA family antidote